MSDNNKIYTCKICKNKFNEEEYKDTKSKNKCIFHCEKEKNQYYPYLRNRIKEIVNELEDNKFTVTFDKCIFSIDAFEDVRNSNKNLFSFKEKKFSFYDCTFYCSIPYNQEDDLVNFKEFVNCKFYAAISLQERKAFESEINNKPYYFYGCDFYNIVNIQNEKKFSGNNLFNDCTFHKYTFPQNKDLNFPSLKIRDSIFETSLELRNSKIDEISIINTEFKSSIEIGDDFDVDEIKCENSKINGDFILYKNYEKDTIYLKSLSLFDCTIKGKVDLRNCDINKINFKDTIFKNTIDVFDSTLNETCFERTIFEDVVVFNHTTFKQKVDLNLLLLED
jgi:uncharacterized protein YjbI with pentapeptide repeats